MKKKKIQRQYPPATIGIVGGGQLGRMFVFEAKRMGYRVIVLDPKENSPAGQVADEQIMAGFDEMWAYLELAQKTDVITYEFEHINAKILSELEDRGYHVIPSAKTLETIQNKYVQKTMLKEIGVKVPEFSLIHSLEDLRMKFETFNKKAILKSATHGYDGKGNMIIKDANDLERAFQLFGNQQIFIETFVDFVKEVSIMIVKRESEVLLYPVSENIHHDSILIQSLIPASISDETTKEIHQICHKIMEKFDDDGVYCVEFFIDNNFEVLVNEIAPRPHNSGHYTIEGCITSQFEQLLRVVCNMPLGSTQQKMPCVMYNVLGSKNVTGEYEIGGLEKILHIEDCHFHLYGKQETGNLRKIGHITALDKNIEGANLKAKQALEDLQILAKHKTKEESQ